MKRNWLGDIHVFSVFTHVNYLYLMLSALTTRGSSLSAEQVDQLQDKAQKELVMVRQRLDETMSQEKRSMRCGLIKKRRELVSDMVKRHVIKPNINVSFHIFIRDCFCHL